MLIAASLSAEKGHLVAVEALRLLKAMGVDLQLWIAGGSLDQSQNPFVSVLRERIVAAGLADSVLLLGEVTMVRELARRAWVGLQLRSTPEPFGLWSLEAMEAGLPLVATNTGGTPELVRDGIDGLLIPPGRPDAIAAAVLRLHRDPLLRQKLSENARLRAKAFSVDAFKHKLSALYSELAS
jgi:glycosyltransferase involved in cell wall biosynthesis